MPQGSIQWQGTQRRACGPGANWNVQVVRGKVTTRCLWHACKALGIGLLLMLLGACMATIGYYADQLSVAQEIRGNITVKVKNESRGFHLNNLSYAGPVVMGLGGFIVVAACVMTFEARDSAAKVVPARYRYSQASTIRSSKNQRNRRSTSSQTTKWDHQLGLFRVNRSPSPSTHEVSRKQLTAEFMQFSKDLREKGIAHSIKKSPSAPTLIDKKSPRRRSPKYAGCSLLNPELLQRHALSVDNPSYSPHQVSRESLEHQKMSGSQVSMAMDLHIPNKGPVTLKVKDRSDTARRHQLLRQTKVEDVEEVDEAMRPPSTLVHSPKLPGAYCRYPDDFVPRKRNSIDLRLLEELTVVTKEFSKASPRDFRKISSPNFRKMSFDRIGGDRRFDRTMGYRKASFEFRRSPDFRRGDYRKLSVDRFSVDCTRYMFDETEMKSRASSGENLRRQSRHPKLHHSRSDDNRRRSVDRHSKDPQSSRHSLNTQAIMSSGSDCEPKYFMTVSLDTEESHGDSSDESHVVDIEEANASALSSEGPTEGDMLLKEPELENVTEINVESSGDDLDDNGKTDSCRSTSERTDMTLQGQTPIIIADDMDSQTIVEEASHNSRQIKRNEKYETTLYIEDDEV
ncbi:T200A protein, partial [Pseudoatta argentina]